MAGRRPLSRPRTRLYDCNYSLGEQLYKPMVDRLDRKYSGRPAEDTDLTTRRPVSFAEGDDIPRRRSLSSLLGETPSTPASQTAAQMLAEMEEDEMSSASLKRMRAARAAGRSLTLDEELADPDSVTSRLRHRPKLALSDRLMDSVGLKTGESGELESDSFFKRRTLKDTEENGLENGTLTKWSSMKQTAARRALEVANAADAEEDAASALRARRSRARIAEIENEMEELAERAAGRAGRRAIVAARLAEAAEIGDGAETTAASSTTSAVRMKKTSIHQSSTSEKKMINF